MSRPRAPGVLPARRWLVPLERLRRAPAPVGLSMRDVERGPADTRGRAVWRQRDETLGLELVIAGRTDGPDAARLAFARRACLRLPDLAAAIDAWLVGQGAGHAPDGPIPGRARIERLAFGDDPTDPPEALRVALRMAHATSGTAHPTLASRTLACLGTAEPGAAGFAVLGFLDEHAPWPDEPHALRSLPEQAEREARISGDTARLAAGWREIAALRAAGGMDAMLRAAEDPRLRPFAIGLLETEPSADALAALLTLHTAALADPAAHPADAAALVASLHRQFSTSDDPDAVAVDAALAERIREFLRRATAARCLPAPWDDLALQRLSADVAEAVQR